MEFKEIDSDEDAIFRVSKDEIERAQIGFESFGNRKSSKELGRINTDEIEIDEARLVIAGNLALIRDFSAYEQIEMASASGKAESGARKTVNTGFAALEQAREARK